LIEFRDICRAQLPEREREERAEEGGREVRKRERK
jgi:hypothetical protein